MQIHIKANYLVHQLQTHLRLNSTSSLPRQKSGFHNFIKTETSIINLLKVFHNVDIPVKDIDLGLNLEFVSLFVVYMLHFFIFQKWEASVIHHKEFVVSLDKEKNACVDLTTLIERTQDLFWVHSHFDELNEAVWIYIDKLLRCVVNQVHDCYLVVHRERSFISENWVRDRIVLNHGRFALW